MNFELAKKEDIPDILAIIKQRCNWFKENKIEQWGDWYYTDLYDANYFLEIMEKHSLYVAKEKDEIIGVFLLKTKNEKYWKDNADAYYLDHFVTKLGHPGLGQQILNFINNLAKQNNFPYLRLECMQINPKINEYYQNHGFTFRGSGETPYAYNLWEKEIK